MRVLTLQEPGGRSLGRQSLVVLFNLEREFWLGLVLGLVAGGEHGGWEEDVD